MRKVRWIVTLEGISPFYSGVTVTNGAISLLDDGEAAVAVAAEHAEYVTDTGAKTATPAATTTAKGKE